MNYRYHQHYSGHNRQIKPKILNKSAKAPYNFIPLNEDVIKVDKPKPFDKYYETLYTGYIDVEIKMLTHTYIRKSKNEIDFFKIGDTFKIPGSSLRGLIRNIFEIITYGKFHFFEDKRLGFREVAGRIRYLREKYKEIVDKGVKAGILVKEGKKYYIKRKKSGNGYEEVKGQYKDNNFIYGGKEYRPFKKYLIKHKGKNAFLLVSGYMDKKKTAYVIHDVDESDKDFEKIEVPEDVIKTYKYDKTKGSQLPDLDSSDMSDGFPCFYIENNNDIIEIGFTKNMRVHYRKSIKDHIPKKLIDENTIDLADALFGKIGKEESFASRVFFEDSSLISGEPYKRLFLKTLGAPKPNSFQLYLEQKKTEPTYEVNKNSLKTWADDVNIRGYKLYWHKNTSNEDGKYSFEEKDPQKIKLNERCKVDYKDPEKFTEKELSSILDCNKLQNQLIIPLKPGAIFKGRIRFENLTDYELGALLFAIDLPDEKNLCHKIGMGKPLGLGSIKITSKLVISDRALRYKKLFDEDQWHLAEKPIDKKVFYDAFKNFIVSKLAKKNIQSLWELDRLKLLKDMLYYDESFAKDQKWLELTRYMLIKCECDKCKCLCECKNKDCNEYDNRYVLPRPNEVKKEYK